MSTGDCLCMTKPVSYQKYYKQLRPLVAKLFEIIHVKYRKQDLNKKEKKTRKNHIWKNEHIGHKR